MLLQMTPSGLYCEAGDFHIDPWQAVDRAIITHAHGDHARWGSKSYLGSREGEGVMRTRLGRDASIRSVEFGETVDMNGVQVSLHPAGHILGSAQIRVEYRGEVWVASGDYKVEPDPTCTPFESIRCHTFITESTFGLPIYRWPAQDEVFADMGAWWQQNVERGRASVLLAYALGKAQRLLAGLAGHEAGPILTHGAVEKLTADYRAAGVRLPETTYASEFKGKADGVGALIIAPPSAAASTWLRRFGKTSIAFASGWMRIRGPRRRRAVDRGFVLSDHVDWPGLLGAVEATGAERVWVTHGYREPVVRWLREKGLEAEAIASRWEGEVDDTEGDTAAPTGGGEEGATGPREEPTPTDLPASPDGESSGRPESGT